MRSSTGRLSVSDTPLGVAGNVTFYVVSTFCYAQKVDTT